MTVHSHVRMQFRYLGNRSALTLKPHQKQLSVNSYYLFRARSFIAKHGVLLVLSLSVNNVRTAGSIGMGKAIIDVTNRFDV